MSALFFQPSRDIQAEEDKILDDLEKMDGQRGKKDLTQSIMMMEKDIASLSVQLKSKEDNFDELDDEIIHQVRKEEKSVILCYARAIMDFNPNGLFPLFFFRLLFFCG